ncbi:MAG: hypothetical protein RBS02_02150 [Steroidobacteraceae bacterium]|jgi:hypothetical protein|nr:hypothetical protein [Steroidobacteraceae bacterium]
MKSAAQHRPEDEPTAHNRLRFEAISASIWLAFGLFALPAAIYAVGATLLGPYQEDPRRAGLGAFYAEFFSDLAQPSGRAWWLAVGPLLIVTSVRAVFTGAGRHTGEGGRFADKGQVAGPARSHRQNSAARPAQSRPASTRVEPRIGED